MDPPEGPGPVDLNRQDRAAGSAGQPGREATPPDTPNGAANQNQSSAPLFSASYRRQHQRRHQRQRRSRGGAAAEGAAAGDALRQVEPLPCAERTRSGVTNEGESGSGTGTGRKPPRRAGGRACRGGCRSSLRAESRGGTRPARGRDGQSAMRCTGMPSWVALSRRFSKIPEPGNPITPLGRSFSS